jgi:lactoylglutathione lyase
VQLLAVMIKKLLHTRMRVNDLARTVKFYEEALGLKVSRRHTSPRGAQLAFLATPNSDEEIEICQMPPGAPSVVVQPDLMHLAFEVEDLAAFAAARTATLFEMTNACSCTRSSSLTFPHCRARGRTRSNGPYRPHAVAPTTVPTILKSRRGPM